jgi:hypothetical protein
LIKKDIFRNLMWYVLPDSNKQYPLTLDRVKKIKLLNSQNTIPDALEPVEINTGKPKEEEHGFVDLVGQISLKTLDKSDRKKKPQSQRDNNNNNNNNNNRRPPQRNRPR